MKTLVTLVLFSLLYISVAQSTHWRVSCKHEKNYYLYETHDKPVCTVDQIESLEDIDCDGDYQAYATWNDTIFSIGLASIRVHTCENVLDTVQAYAAGFLEGFITQERTWQFWYNAFLKKMKKDINGKPTDRSISDLSDAALEYVRLNDEYLREKIMKFHMEPYWHLVALSIIQNIGMSDGYNQAAPEEYKIPYDKYRLMNLKESLGDIEHYQPENKTRKNLPKMRDIFLDDHCSALIKVTEDNQDILFAHNTWTDYEVLTRIWKQYEFKFHLNRFSKQLIPSTRVHQSGYPAMIHSMDDFYIMNQQIAVMETTNGVYNMDLYYQYIKPNTVSETIRIMVANRLARNSREWVQIFQRENDGTYCNQWMVVDYKLFTPGKPLPDGLFYIAEQIPGDVVFMDATWVLREKMNWPSYNSPYFEAVWYRTGWKDKFDQWGSFFHHETTTRAMLFKRDQGKVKDMQGMQDMMRLADPFHDPLSTCSSVGLKCDPDWNGGLVIAARNDLTPASGTYNPPNLGHRNHGALDVKITSFSYIKDLKMKAISSPPYENVPAFDWTTVADFNVSHIGLPDKWEFPWVDLAFD